MSKSPHPFATMQCPKCKHWSGDDWSQCKGTCPAPDSPHFDPALTPRWPYDRRGQPLNG